MIAKASECDDKRSRCAVSYLQQVLRDRRDTLALLRKRRRRYHWSWSRTRRFRR